MVFAFNQTHLFKSVDQGQTWLECSALGDGVEDFSVAGNRINIVSRSGMQNKKIEILDLTGKVVYSGSATGNPVNIDFLSPALYLLRMETMNNMDYYEKFVKL